MTVAYFDCFSGASGDMILGALIDAGLSVRELTRILRALPVKGWKIECRKRGGLAGVDLCVQTTQEPRSARYPDLDRMIARAKLPSHAKELARVILAKLAVAEATVHGVRERDIHFHEVGATDSLIDIVGAAVGLAHFDFAEVHASPLPLSRGSVRCHHGVLPVPAPATLALLKGVPLERTEVTGELVTPTGAAILTSVVTHFGECPLQSIDRVGVGFGDRKLPDRPNILRLLMGKGFQAVVIEVDIDDMNPQLFEPVMERLFAAGAVDISLAAIQMKKNRPGIRLSCVAPDAVKDRAIEILLHETTTFGVRYWPVERKVLTRELVTERVRRGKLTFKIGRDAKGRVVKAMPEYEAVKQLARREHRPFLEVHHEAMAGARKLVTY